MTEKIFYKKVNELIESRRKFALCTITKAEGSTPRKEGAKMIVLEDGSIFGTIGGGAIEFDVINKAKENLIQNITKSYDFELKTDLNMACGGRAQVFIEIYNVTPQLIIFGAGHIGSFLAQMSPKFGFSIVLIDNRKEVFENKYFENTKIVNLPYNEAFAHLSFDENTYICVLTHGHEFDKEVAAYCLKQKFAYIGIISSRSKTKDIAKFLKEEHFVSDDLISKIDMPIGIPFNAQTPEEITISILAKLIDVKNSIDK